MNGEGWSPTTIRWRTASGKVQRGIVQGFDPARREYTVVVPEWINDTTYNVVGSARVPEGDVIADGDE